jgi:hypothetical protein
VLPAEQIPETRTQLALICHWVRNNRFRLLTAVALLSICENVILVEKFMFSTESHGSLVGEPLPALHVRDLEGNVRPLNRDRILLFIFSTSCSACLNSFSSWQEIQTATKGDVAFLSVDPIYQTKRFAQQKGISDRTYVLTREDIENNASFQRVPLTLYVEQGRIVASHIGIVTEDLVPVFIHKYGAS